MRQVLGIILTLLVLTGCGYRTTLQSDLTINKVSTADSGMGTETVVTDEKPSSLNSSIKDILTYDGVTSRGTAIVDLQNSEFDIDDVNMLSTPDSSCFYEVGHDNQYNVLVLTFRESRETYLYLNFSESEWKAFRKADSLGSYYNTNIKGQYECNKVR